MAVAASKHAKTSSAGKAAADAAMPEDPRFTAEVIAKVTEIIATAERTGARVAAWDEIKRELIAAKLGWHQQVEAPFCGVHPDNRSKHGVGGSESHCHGRDILKVGFSWQRADADAVATEAPPTGLRKKEAERFNETMSRFSGGLIPLVNVLRILSISGSHTNTFIRAVIAGCESAVPELADADGRLSAENLCLGRETFKEAVESGLRWFVLQHECEIVWPGLISLVEKALNTRAAEQQSEIEVMLAMHAAHAHAFKRDVEPNWPQIEKDASCSLPPCAAWVNVLADYVRQNSGGVDGELLVDLRDFSRVFRCSEAGSKRMLGSDFWRKLSSLHFGIDRFPYVVNACIKAGLQSPANKVTDGFCKLVQPSHLSMLTTKSCRESVIAAESIMTDARKLMQSLKIEHATSVKLLGQLDVRAVLHIMKLGKIGEGVEWDNLASIAEAPTSSNTMAHILATCTATCLATCTFIGLLCMLQSSH